MTGGVVPSLQPTRFTDLPAVTTVNLTDLMLLSQGGRTVKSTVQYFLTQSSFLTDPMTTIGDMIIRNASNVTARLGVGATASMLSVAAGIPAWTTSVWPATTTINQILYSSSANTIAGLATANTGVLVTSSAGVPSVTSGSTANRLLRTDGTTVAFGQAVLTTDVTGNLPVGNLGSGTGATANTLFHGNATWSAVSLTADVTGNLPVGNLGSGTGATANTLFHGNATWSAVSLTADVTGTLPLGNGGTNAVDAAGARVTILPAMAGKAGQILSVNGGETDATWISAGAGGTVTSVGLAGTAAEITVTGSTPITGAGSWTLSLPTAMTMTGKTMTGGAYTAATWDNGIIGGSSAAAITGTTVVGNSFTVNSSTIPANGIYLPAANTVGVAVNSLLTFRVSPTASSVNYVNVTASATGVKTATISTGGSDADIDLQLVAKGAGYVTILSSPGLKFPDATIQTTAAVAGLTLAQTQAAALSF